jgi:PKD repeat protein
MLNNFIKNKDIDMLKYLVKWGGISNTIIPKMVKSKGNGANGAKGTKGTSLTKVTKGTTYTSTTTTGATNGDTNGDIGPVLSGTVPLSVQFSNQSTGDGLTYLWKFGDGGTSNEHSPSHIYHSTGVFPVNLTTTNNYGSSTLTGTVTVTNVSG